MKFEKLTNSKIRIIFTLEDMINNNVSAEGFFSDKLISQKILQSLLIQAEKEIGFKADDCKLLVEAISSSDGGVIFTITKLSTYDKINLKNKLNISPTLIYKFENFDNFLDLCTYLNNIDNIDLKNISKNFSLIVYNNEYYLYSSSNEIPNCLINVFIEFGELISYTPTIDGLIHEYGKFIYKNNAINKCLKNIQ